MDNQKLLKAIEAKGGERVTQELIESKISHCSSAILPNTTTTICTIHMNNGFNFIGQSACVDPKNFDVEIGEAMAYKDAFRQIWAYEGYLLSDQRYQAFVKSQTVEVKND